MWKICYFFDRWFLVETLNQCICYLTKRKQRKHSVVKLAISKSLVILCNMEVSGLAENKTRRELRSFENTELGFRYTIFVCQFNQRVGMLHMRAAQDLAERLVIELAWLLACKAVFCWCCVSLRTVQKENCKPKNSSA